MSRSRFADLRAREKPRAAASQAENEEEEEEPNEVSDENSEPEEPKKETDMTDETTVDETEARAAGAQDQIDRHQAVFASEHFEGREKHATKFLANAKLSSDEIIDLLAGIERADKQSADDDAIDKAATAKVEKVLNNDKDADLGSEEVEEEEEPTSKAQAILRDQAAVTGKKITK